MTHDVSAPLPDAAADVPPAVTLTHGKVRDGRLPVTVTVVPTADFDAQTGVFVDFRDGAPRAEASAMVSRRIARPRTLKRGRAETLEVDVAMPPDGQSWLVRARFATTSGGPDLESDWVSASG